MKWRNSSSLMALAPEWRFHPGPRTSLCSKAINSSSRSAASPARINCFSIAETTMTSATNFQGGVYEQTVRSGTRALGRIEQFPAA
jgi:hypothetical protein